jgi:hypothetical protein
MSLVLAIAIVLVFVLCLQRLVQSPEGEAEPQGATEADVPLVIRRSGTRSEVSRAIVQRAWQAAVIAVLTFPPLAFYSMRLLWKLNERDTPLGWPDRCRMWAAFFLSMGAILLCMAIVGLGLYAFVSAFR